MHASEPEEVDGDSTVLISAGFWWFLLCTVRPIDLLLTCKGSCELVLRRAVVAGRQRRPETVPGRN